MGAIKQNLKKMVGCGLGPFGFDRYAPKAPAVTNLASPMEAIYSQSDIVFEVPVEMCVTSYHFSYHSEGWHPFVEALRQYGKDRTTTFEASSLRKYYDRHRPERLWDVFFEGDEYDSTESQFKSLRTENYLTPNPWDPKLHSLRGEGRLAPSHGVQAHGPVSPEKGEWEFSRLISVYRSIESKGYQPGPGSDDEIRGYFLKLGHDYRFFVRAGLHRMATVAALEYPRIRMKFKTHFPRVVDLDDIDFWPLVRSGIVERKVAARIFQKYFTDNGNQKARNLGLLECRSDPPPKEKNVSRVS